MARINYGGDVFESGYEVIDVTCHSRPDTSWSVIDAQGHEHRWYVNGQPATSYSPMAKHDTPTLVWVKDGEESWEDDDEPHDIGHRECSQCGEHVVPHYTHDSTTQYIPGVRWFEINGQPVSADEFERRLTEAQRG